MESNMGRHGVQVKVTPITMCTCYGKYVVLVSMHTNQFAYMLPLNIYVTVNMNFW